MKSTPTTKLSPNILTTRLAAPSTRRIRGAYMASPIIVVRANHTGRRANADGGRTDMRNLPPAEATGLVSGRNLANIGVAAAVSKAMVR
jgi:hypothetical protein